jgi:hypothetical protein
MFIAKIPEFKGQLSVVVHRANGSTEKERIVSSDMLYTQPRSFWRALWRRLRREAQIPAAMGFTAFLAWMLDHEFGVRAPMMYSLVTTAGVNYLCNNFANAGGANVANFLYHETGTSNTPATISQTDLSAPISQARVAGSNSNPAAGQFLSSATIAYSNTYTLQEWGLYSSLGAGLPPTGGTLWDRRVISPPQGVNSGDSVTYSYLAIATAGGS